MDKQNLSTESLVEIAQGGLKFTKGQISHTYTIPDGTSFNHFIHCFNETAGYSVYVNKSFSGSNSGGGNFSGIIDPTSIYISCEQSGNSTHINT